MRTIVFDLGGVAALYRPERRLEALSSLSGVAPSVIDQRLFDSGFEHNAELGYFTPHEVLSTIQAVLETQIPAAQLTDAWAMAFEPDTEVLKYVSSLPYRRALFTNNGPMMDACLAGPLRGLAAHFSQVICSWHIKARKPESASFERAAGRLGCSPTQLLLLDDSLENTVAAVQCGWDACCISSIDELVAALRDTIKG